MKTRLSLTLSGPKNVGIKSKVVRAQETMLLNRTRRSKTSGQESAGVESEVVRTQEKLLLIGYVFERTSLNKSPLDSSPRTSEKKHTQKMLILCFMSRFSASYGPKVEQPNVLVTPMFAHASR